MAGTFTPGEWFAKQRRVGEYLFNWQVVVQGGYFKENGKRIAVAAFGGSDAEANARLSAKSPEMYRLLQDIRHQLATDSDLEGLVGAPKYQAIVDLIDKLDEEVKKRDG